jgi:hypothetical protein
MYAPTLVSTFVLIKIKIFTRSRSRWKNDADPQSCANQWNMLFISAKLFALDPDPVPFM